MMVKDYSSVYYYLYDNLYRNLNSNKPINKNELRKYICKANNIPHRLLPIIIREMEHRGLIERISRDFIRLKSKPLNVLNNLGKIASMI